MPDPTNARVVARRFLATAAAPVSPGNDSRDEADPMATVERLLRVLSEELSRWFGPYGYRALLTRTLAETRSRDPVLATVQIRSATEPWLVGLSDAAQLHGVDAVTEGVANLLTALIELLGRLIGEDLAVTLVSQAMIDRQTGTGSDPKPDAGGRSGAGGAT